MEAAIFISLVVLVVILGSLCFWLNFVNKWNRNDLEQVMANVWKLQDKYDIPDEEIRGCFRVEHN